MHRRTFTVSLLACPVCPALAQALKAIQTPEWNYDSAGPAKWGRLSPAYNLCATGDQQSPVDLRNGIPARVAPVRLDWKSGRFTVVNNSHSIQANVPPGSSATIGAERFELIQFHFHTPSEHAVSEKRSAMEVHFVHMHQDGRIAVLGAFLEAGGHNEAFSAVMKVAPAKAGGEAPTESVVDPRQMVPGPLDSWRYEGSLTTPPCSQIVSWVVFARTVPVAQSGIDAFRKIFPMNARPLQQVNRRYLLRGAQ
jgi:carbonic anhydrase